MGGPVPTGAFGGAVLVGGAARRMGGEKANRVVGGRSLAAHVAEALGRAGARPVALIGNRAVTDLPELLVVADRWPGEGPLGGVAAALGAAAGAPEEWPPIVVVAACDQPDLDPGLIVALVLALRDAAPEHLVAIPRTPDGRRHPFPAAWRTDAAAVLVALVEAGERRAHAGVAAAQAIEVPADPGSLRDLDTPEAVEAWASQPRERSRP